MDSRGESSSRERPANDCFGRQGWLLVAGIAIAFVVVPVVIYLNPPQLPFVFSYLVLPLVPAILLAVLAVYVTTTS